MQNDRHLNVIELNTMDNVSEDSLMYYKFGDGTEKKCKRLSAQEENELAKIHNGIDIIKRADGI